MPPRSTTGGAPPRRLNITLTTEDPPSHDSTPFISVHTHHSTDTEPRPRPSLQIYYTAPDASDTAVLERVAGELESNVLAPRLIGSEFRDRLDVYGLPLATADTNMVGNEETRTRASRCAENQRGEIAAREGSGSKEWYIQRWDLGGPNRDYKHLLVMIEKPFSEWGTVTGDTDLGIVLVSFDVVERERDEDEMVRDMWVRRVGNLAQARDRVREERGKLNWQNTRHQFED